MAKYFETSRKYVVTEEGRTVKFKIDCNGAITITTNKEKDTFMFKKSKPDTIRAIGHILVSIADRAYFTKLEVK